MRIGYQFLKFLTNSIEGLPRHSAAKPGRDREAGDESCAPALVCDAFVGEWNGLAEDPGFTGARGYYHDGDLSACGNGREWIRRGESAGSNGERRVMSDE